MIVRIVLLWFLCSQAFAQEIHENAEGLGEYRRLSNDANANSIPQFDHAPGQQRSIPSLGSVPSRRSQDIAPRE